MNSQLVWVLILLLIVVTLFMTNKIRMDVVALLVIVALVLSGTLTLKQATIGFSDPNVLLIAALFVFSEGLVRTGIAYQVGDWLVGVAGNNENKMLIFFNDNSCRFRRIYELHRHCCHFYSSCS